MNPATETVRQMADRVREARQKAWASTDCETAIVATEQLNPEDENVVRRVVAEAGYTGQHFEDMVKAVSTRVVGQVGALADHMPADGGD